MRPQGHRGQEARNHLRGTLMHSPHDGEFAHTLGLRYVTLIGSLRRPNLEHFRGLKVWIDAQLIVAFSASPLAVLCSANGP